MRILILYAKAGGGHESIALALKEKLEAVYGKKVTITLADPLTPFFDHTYHLSTLFSAKFYNAFYKFTAKPLPRQLIQTINTYFHKEKLIEIITKYNPDLILSTYFLFSGEAKAVLAEMGRNIPVVVYIADPFTSHPVWFSRRVDLFLSFDREHLPNLRSFSISEKQVISIGLPIRNAFFSTYNRTQTLTSLGFDPKKLTIIFGGSGSGMDYLERIAHSLLRLKPTFQAIFLTGRNTILEKALTLLFANHPNFSVFGLLPPQEMARLMQVSDLFVGKAGPNALFEAVLCGLPLIATPPILEQEIGNRQFIKTRGIGYLSKNSLQTITWIKFLLKNRSRLDALKKNVAVVRRELISREKRGFPKFISWINSTL